MAAKDAVIKARVDGETLAALDEVVQVSNLGDRSDHIRAAVAEYLQRWGARREQARTLVQDEDGTGLLVEWD